MVGDEPLIHPSGHLHHYSNPGYTLLGSLVEALRGDSWAGVLRREILEPLGMDRTTPQASAPHAGGWAVHPWADVMLPEPAEDLGLMAPAGQLWSTTSDLLRFAGFLAQGDERVLCAASVAEMRAPAAPPETGDWAGAYGLGLQALRRGNRTLFGHSGSLPGFLATLLFSVEDDVAAVVLSNATSGPLTGTVAADLIQIVADAEPRMPEPWRPLPEVDAGLLALTGPWYWGTQVHALKLLADGVSSSSRCEALAVLHGSGHAPTARGWDSTATTRGRRSEWCVRMTARSTISTWGRSSSPGSRTTGVRPSPAVWTRRVGEVSTSEQPRCGPKLAMSARWGA